MAKVVINIKSQSHCDWAAAGERAVAELKRGRKVVVRSNQYDWVEQFALDYMHIVVGKSGERFSVMRFQRTDGEWVFSFDPSAKWLTTLKPSEDGFWALHW